MAMASEMSAKPLPEHRKDLIVYPAAPMSGIKDQNRPWFEYIVSTLQGRGYSVIPPVEIQCPGFNYGGRDHEDFLRADIDLALSKCNAILLGPGWTRSRGARDEFNYAAATGRFIFFWDSHREEMVRMDMHIGPPQ